MDGEMAENYYEETNYEEEDYEEERLRRQRRLQRIEEMRRRKKQTVLLHRIAFLGVCMAVGILAGFGILGLRNLAGQGSRIPGEQVQNLPKDETLPADENGGAFQGGTGDGNGIGGESNAFDQGTDNDSQSDQVPTGAFGAGNGTVGSTDPGYGGMGPFLPEQYRPVFQAERNDDTEGFSENVVSPYGIFIDVSSGSVLACREGYTRMNPASMTKILTVLVAAEALGIRTGEEPVLEDTVEITIEITDYCFVNKCSVVGFEVGERVTVRDLFYGTILPSGADAALGLAAYVSGSQEAFVERMNQKLEDLGLGESTHFTNCVGLYNENHYSTAYDMAVILKMAADNPFCRMALSAHTYNTSLTKQHPEGLLASNWFLRRIEDKDTHGEVLCGKTGYVDQSGSCAASLAVDRSGKEYLCVTAGAGSSFLCIADHVELYQKYLQGDSGGQ